MEKSVVINISIDEFKDLLKKCIREVLTENSQGAETLYTPGEARDLLRISRTTENKLNREGTLTPVWVGGRKKYTREAIEGAIMEI